MQSGTPQPPRGKALAALFLLAAAPALAQEPVPLPPPSELVGQPGYSADGAARTANPGPNQQRYFQPAPAAPYSPAPGRPPYSAGQTPPPQPVPSPAPHFPPPPRRVPDTSALSGGFTVSPPAQFMPDEYFLLPMIEDEIPGVLMPELDESFAEPGGTRSGGRRRIVPGMSESQLAPYFEQAKGSEKAALEAQKFGDDYLFRRHLGKAVEAYMRIIPIADAGIGAREEAWYGVARCEYRLGNWWQAFDALERSFPEKYDRAEVQGRIKLEMFIGERLWRLGYQPAPGAAKDSVTLTGYQAADLVYTAAIFNQPNSRDAPVALLRRGDVAAMNGDWEKAAKFYRTVIHYYPESEGAMQARSSLAEAVLRHRQEVPGGLPEVARDDLAQIMEPVETTERRLSPEAEERRQRAVPLANEEEAGMKLRHAKDYLKNVRVKKSRDAAVFLLGEVVSHYPATPQAREAAELLQDMGIDPPMVLSDGDRFPYTVPRAGAEPGIGGGPGGGSIRLEGQNTARRSSPRDDAPEPRARPVERASPSPHPVDVVVPGVDPDM